MNWLTLIVEWGAPILFSCAVAAVFIWAGRRFIPDEPRTRVFRQVWILAVVLATNVLIVLVLPLDAETRGQLLSLFGRVTESGLLHTEIQSVDRDLVTLPNLFVMNQPVKVVRSSGTLIRAEVSLGYDVHRNQIRGALKEAAEAADLKEPFVQIVSLKDHAVVYQVLGFLEDVSNLVSKRTELNSRVLGGLHAAGIEIVSPGFVNQRRLDPDQRFIPVEHAATTPEDTEVEKLMFDKAELADHLTTLRHQKEELEAEIDNLKASADTSPAEITWRKNQIKSLDRLIESIESE